MTDYSNCSILIVDDVPVNLMIVEKMLTNYHFNIIKADNGQKALDIVAGSRPDLILLDIMMPGIDGFETLRRLRENADSSNIPVILMSALNSDADVKKGLSLGANDFLTKPIIKEQLDNCIKNHLKPQAATGKPDSAETAGNDSRVDIRTTLLSYLFCSGREEVKRLILQTLLGVPELWIGAALFEIMRETDEETVKGRILQWLAGKIDGCDATVKTIDAGQVIRKAIDNLSPVLSERGLTAEIAPGVEATGVKTVPDLFESVIRLLAAAISRVCSNGRIVIGREIQGREVTLTLSGVSPVTGMSGIDFSLRLADDIARKAGCRLSVISDPDHILFRLSLTGDNII